jgi:hypothetical protein
MDETDAQCVTREQREKAATNAEAVCARQAECAVIIAYEQAPTASLHAPNFHALVPIILRSSFYVVQPVARFLPQHLGKYVLTNHVNLDAAPTNDVDGDAMECIVCSWMYASIAPDLLNDIMTPGASARHV